MEILTSDLKSGARSLLRDWRFSATVVLTLMVCIGANSALFTIVNSVLLRPLPIPDAGSLVLMSNQYPGSGAGGTSLNSGADYYDRRREVSAFSEQALFNLSARTLTGSGSPERMEGMTATPSLFRLLGIRPVAGRIFEDSEGEIGSEQKVILSYRLWQKLYAGDTGVTGKELRLSDRPYTIAGVMPREFLFIDPQVQFWVPLALTPEQKNGRHSNNWFQVGRLAPGATIGQARAQINALNAANLERFPQWKQILINVGFHTKVEPLQEMLVRDVESTLYLLWAGAAFVLLIGAVNLANLALARTTLRMKEFGTRIAIGASRLQIARQLIVENVIVALIGGVAGLALAALILKLLEVSGLDQFPRATEVRIDLPVVLFSLALAIGAGLLIALIPLAAIVRASLVNALRENSRTGSAGRRASKGRKLLVVAQVGFAFVLLTGSGLLLASFSRILSIDPGFRTEGVLTISTSIPDAAYKDDTARRILTKRLTEALRRIPGVQHAGATTSVPFTKTFSDNVILADGYVTRPGESLVAPLQTIVTPGYMEAMGIGLVSGRYFTEADNERSPRAVIVDERLARKFWPDRDAVGKRMFLPSGPADLTPNEKTEFLHIAGVVKSVRLNDLTGGGNQAGAFYFPYAQDPTRNYTFAISASMDHSAITKAARAAVAGVDPSLALFDVRSMQERRDLSLSSRKIALALAIAFGGVALFLSAVGIYGVLSYLLTLRRREIGIRLAIGSSQGGIFRLFLRDGLVLIGAGLALGLSGAAVLRTAIEKQVFETHPLDPLVIGLVLLLLGGVALAACLRPAQLATRIDPNVVLNEQ